jgi:DNA-binding IclR family transcriptional regulator
VNAPVDMVRRVSALLRVVSSSPPGGRTTSEIAATTGLARPTVHRLLTSLQAEGLLDRDHRGRWLVGPELYLMGASAAARYDVTEVAHPHVRRLAAATGESAFFSARRGDETVCLIREDGSFPIRSHVLYEGIRFPLGVASAGLAILAYLADEEVERYLSDADLTEQYGTAHAREAVEARVRKTRSTGYALNPGLIVEGSWGMGAAVFDQHDRPRWAVSLTGIEQRFGPERRKRLGTLLLQTAHTVTLALR